MYGILDFYIAGEITISTVHKAKGNEAYQVYVVGVDAIFNNPDIIHRNRLFTAMTRAKAWVTITGVGSFCTEMLRRNKSGVQIFSETRLCISVPKRH